MKSNLKLDEYLNAGIDKLLKGAMRATLQNPKESIFLARYSFSAMKANSIRNTYGQMGKHIPPFLIACIRDRRDFSSIRVSNGMNLSEKEEESQKELSKEEWGRIFKEASDLGIGVITLTGKEPLVRRDVIEEAALHRSIVFPIMTKGRDLLEYLDLLDANRNLIPILAATREERQKYRQQGKLEYNQQDERQEEERILSLEEQMDALQKKQIYFGVSMTVKHGNIEEVTNQEYLNYLRKRGCGIVLYLDYVPYREETRILAPDEEERIRFQEQLEEIRKEKGSMLYLSLPGDEKEYGGCLAAGRGFFYITPEGKAEPCPYSPYSDISVREHSLLEVLDSSLFKKLRENQNLMVNHKGNCVLFEQENIVRQLLDS